jgi:hypothetical protein
VGRDARQDCGDDRRDRKRAALCSTPPELADFRMTGYDELISGTNRVIVDTRSDLADVLARRLFRI